MALLALAAGAGRGRHGPPPIIMLLVSESVVVLFILLRRPTREISRRPGDWALGLSGTLLPLLAIAPKGAPAAGLALSAALMAAGFLLQLWAKLTLRRSFGVVAANRGVKATGPYAFVRHPMYAGYALTHIGFLLAGRPCGISLSMARPSPSRCAASSPRSAC